MTGGDLVRIDPIWFGYDNIYPEWHGSVFVVVEVCRDVKRVLVEPHSICRVLTPDGTLF
jgi:hypothetical protein